MLKNIKAIEDQITESPGKIADENSRYSIFVTTSSNNRMIWFSKKGFMTFNEDEAATWDSRDGAEDMAKMMSDKYETLFLVTTSV